MGKILVADDSDVMRSTLVAVFRLARPEAELLEASDGQDAISLAIAHQPDLIVMDGEMPKVNGYQAAQMLRNIAQTCSIPIIGISAETNENPVVDGLQRLCNVFWAKPVPIDLLLAFVDHVLESNAAAASS